MNKKSIMDKKILILIGFLFIGYVGTSQKLGNEGKWEVATELGATKLYNNSTLNTGDNVNVGLSLEAKRLFGNNLFVSAGTTFSTLKNTFLWDNPLNYFSIDLYSGYRFNSNGLTNYSLAIGTSYISAPNTVPNGSSSFSLNFSGGFIFWLRDSNYGIILRNTYKAAMDDNYVSHNRLSVGLAYKL